MFNTAADLCEYCGAGEKVEKKKDHRPVVLGGGVRVPQKMTTEEIMWYLGRTPQIEDIRDTLEKKYAKEATMYQAALDVHKL